MTQFIDQADYPISRLYNFSKWQKIECLLHKPWITDRAHKQGSLQEMIKSLLATDHISDMSL